MNSLQKNLFNNPDKYAYDPYGFNQQPNINAQSLSRKNNQPNYPYG